MEKIFTIIICTYNSEKRITNVINKIINQNKYVDLVKEMLIVDNNSNDNTKNEIMDIMEKNKSIKYVFEKKQGLSNARLAGVNKTSTDWIIFIDDDNLLEDNWLIYAYEFINNNNRIGAFNGAVVPKIDYQLSNEEIEVLSVIYKGLACTHIKKEEIDKRQKNHPNVIPFGAGLIIRTKPLQELADNGWLVSTGRNGEKLVSGEDSEMCRYIYSKGYEFGYEPQMVMQHIIPKSRLDKKYAIKLYSSFAEYNYSVSSSKRFYILRRIKLIYSSIKKLLMKKSTSFVYEINREYLKVYINNIKKDKLIFK